MTFDLSKSYLPIAVVVTLIGATFAAGTFLGRTLQVQEEVQTKLTNLSDTVERLDKTVSRLEQSVEVFANGSDRWSKSNHFEFCWAAERLNKGWRCPYTSKQTHIDISDQ